ncbi:uncharacterized protein si:dkey-10c21.1 [Betta splendens]|uniref:Uncharacterized protein si:dkey-10c21.1 n=1 Tax=Betta splendens TaxID=158456 RepID=A0A6P7LEY2_BETSP|nr:uncharacterized protein si:dkey-10c21.1 [Betta splendens]
MTLDKLRKEQPRRLCELLSNDPDYILEECGDLLSMNEYRQIEKQTCALQKMNLLLSKVKQQEETCQSFDAILRKHGDHYQQWLSPTPELSAPTALADDSSVFNKREIRDTRAKSLNMKTEVLNESARSPSGGFTGPVAQHRYKAVGGSIICVDKLSGVTVDGGMDLSVSSITVTSQRRSGGAEDRRPSSQQKWMQSCDREPAVKRIMENKTELVDCLSSDCTFILQQVHSEDIVTGREYRNLKEEAQSEKAVIDLLDLLIAKGQESCSSFLELLKDQEVLETFPKLKKLELEND